MHTSNVGFGSGRHDYMKDYGDGYGNGNGYGMDTSGDGSIYSVELFCEDCEIFEPEDMIGIIWLNWCD